MNRDEDTYKENLRNTVSKVFGLDLTPEELEEMYALARERSITPQVNGKTILFSPLILQSFVQKAIERGSLSSIRDRRLKKITEEIFPAMHFVLFLKMIGMGEFMLISSDVPDIYLIKTEDAKIREGKNLSGNDRIAASPLEITSIKDHSLDGVIGTTDAERVANALISKKFNKTYDSQTTLLVILDTEVNDLPLKDLSVILSKNNLPFHSIWIYGRKSDGLCVVAQLYPNFTEREFDPNKDFNNLMY